MAAKLDEKQQDRLDRIGTVCAADLLRAFPKALTNDLCDSAFAPRVTSADRLELAIMLAAVMQELDALGALNARGNHAHGLMFLKPKYVERALDNRGVWYPKPLDGGKRAKAPALLRYEQKQALREALAAAAPAPMEE